MKLAIILVAMILLSCFEPTMQARKRRGRVLRMCDKRFTTCLSNSRFRRSFTSGPKCCGRAWTVSSANEFMDWIPDRSGLLIKKKKKQWKTKTNKATNKIWFLPCTQKSLLMKICAQRRAGRRKPFGFASHFSPPYGPLRFVTSHSRSVLASVRKTKSLRRRLIWFNLSRSHFNVILAKITLFQTIWVRQLQEP